MYLLCFIFVDTAFSLCGADLQETIYTHTCKYVPKGFYWCLISTFFGEAVHEAVDHGLLKKVENTALYILMVEV